MAEQVKITNKNLSALINFRGAELVSLKDKEKEFIWQGDPNFWASHAPILFPFCGALLYDSYLLNGKKYNMPKHGYAKKVDFSLVEKSQNSVTFVLSDDQSSKEIFPFEFDLFVKYTLTDCLTIEYIVLNKGSEKMYFTLGSHEGYALKGNFSDYSILFSEKENLKAITLDGSYITDGYTDLGMTDRLNLNYEHFYLDALVFKDIKSKRITLTHNKSGEILSVDIDENFKHLLLWTKPNAPYICIEPWISLPDNINSNQDITKKPDVCVLDVKEKKTFTHIIKPHIDKE